MTPRAKGVFLFSGSQVSVCSVVCYNIIICDSAVWNSEGGQKRGDHLDARRWGVFFINFILVEPGFGGMGD